MKRRIAFLLFVSALGVSISTLGIFLTAPTVASAATLNAGFVNGVWYSKYPFYADDLINIYSAIQNRSDTDLSGKVGFYIDDVEIGNTSVKVAKSSIAIASIQWKATTGNRAIHAKIIELRTPDGTLVSSNVLAAKTDADSVKIEVDPEVVRAEAAKKAEIEARAKAAERARASSTLDSALAELDTTKPIAPLLQNTENSLLSAAGKISDTADVQAKKAAQFLLDQKKGAGTADDSSSSNSDSATSRFAATAYNSLLDVSATALLFWKLVLAAVIVILLLLKARSWARRRNDPFA